MVGVSIFGLVPSLFAVRDTSDHVAHEQAGHSSDGSVSLQRALRASVRVPVLRACSQARFVNNLNDAVLWGLVPLYLAAHGADATQIGLAAGLYPAVWGVSQIGTGWLSDHVGRKRPIVAGMLVQAVGLAVLVSGGGRLGSALFASILLGLGTALAYPTLIAAVSDVVSPRERAPAVGVYRFWRDSGFVAGAVALGLVADASGLRSAIAVTAALTAISGIWVALVRFRTPVDKVEVRHHELRLEGSAERA